MAGGEHRPEQQEMCRAVAEALATGTHLVVQAGTGNGKSLAYLVPAALSGQRVVGGHRHNDSAGLMPPITGSVTLAKVPTELRGWPRVEHGPNRNRRGSTAIATSCVSVPAHLPGKKSP
jgi:hypothetical protein